MKIALDGKTAIVTGSSAGIGWEGARGLADAGATVVIAGEKDELFGADRVYCHLFFALGDGGPPAFFKFANPARGQIDGLRTQWSSLK